MDELPDEILHLIFSHCDTLTLQQVGLTNKRFGKVVNKIESSDEIMEKSVRAFTEIFEILDEYSSSVCEHTDLYSNREWMTLLRRKIENKKKSMIFKNCTWNAITMTILCLLTLASFMYGLHYLGVVSEVMEAYVLKRAEISLECSAMIHASREKLSQMRRNVVEGHASKRAGVSDEFLLKEIEIAKRHFLERIDLVERMWLERIKTAENFALKRLDVIVEHLWNESKIFEEHMLKRAAVSEEYWKRRWKMSLRYSLERLDVSEDFSLKKTKITDECSVKKMGIVEEQTVEDLENEREYFLRDLQAKENAALKMFELSEKCDESGLKEEETKTGVDATAHPNNAAFEDDTEWATFHLCRDGCASDKCDDLLDEINRRSCVSAVPRIVCTSHQMRLLHNVKLSSWLERYRKVSGTFLLGCFFLSCACALTGRRFLATYGSWACVAGLLVHFSSQLMEPSGLSVFLLCVFVIANLIMPAVFASSFTKAMDDSAVTAKIIDINHLSSGGFAWMVLTVLLQVMLAIIALKGKGAHIRWMWMMMIIDAILAVMLVISAGLIPILKKKTAKKRMCRLFLVTIVGILLSVTLFVVRKDRLLLSSLPFCYALFPAYGLSAAAAAVPLFFMPHHHFEKLVLMRRRGD